MAAKLPKDEDHFRQVWDGDSETDCVEICRDLQKAGIEYRTDQQPVSRSSRMRVNWKFKVYVLASDCQTARRALGPVEETESDDSVFEIEEKTGTGGDLNQEYRARSQAYLNEWDSKRATVASWKARPRDEGILDRRTFAERESYSLSCRASKERSAQVLCARGR